MSRLGLTRPNVIPLRCGFGVANHQLRLRSTCLLQVEGVEGVASGAIRCTVVAHNALEEFFIPWREHGGLEPVVRILFVILFVMLPTRVMPLMLVMSLMLVTPLVFAVPLVLVMPLVVVVPLVVVMPLVLVMPLVTTMTRLFPMMFLLFFVCKIVEHCVVFFDDPELIRGDDSVKDLESTRHKDVVSKCRPPRRLSLDPAGLYSPLQGRHIPMTTRCGWESHQPNCFGTSTGTTSPYFNLAHLDRQASILVAGQGSLGMYAGEAD